MSTSIHWSILLCFPTEVPALFEAFSTLTTEDLIQAVESDLRTCQRLTLKEEHAKEAAFIAEHLATFANDELESRGLERRF